VFNQANKVSNQEQHSGGHFVLVVSNSGTVVFGAFSEKIYLFLSVHLILLLDTT